MFETMRRAEPDLFIHLGDTIYADNPIASEVKLEDGVRLVYRSLFELLAKQGLSEIDTNGKFDPHVHEALLSQPSDEEEGSVIEVVQKGYKLGDKVLRPARVVVAGPAAEPPVREADQGKGSQGKREVPPASDDR